eukprot:scpid49679/ scgid29395/ Diamine acetyltransferase 2; Polyamine N-acetyltransferase 2; Spermidine/spermine N(1)-acetyltransferase 2; Thialysine N-epsilon-acetyltransferase
MAENVRIRETTAEDMPTLRSLIEAFLPFVSNAPGDAVNITVEDLVRDGFGDKPCFTCLFLEVLEDGKPPQVAGYTLYYFAYSTWSGRVLFMEDIFVLPEHHRKGFGKFILKHLAKIALDNKCERLSWQGIKERDCTHFYNAVGAGCNSAWSNFKLDVQGMASLLEEP